MVSFEELRSLLAMAMLYSMQRVLRTFGVDTRNLSMLIDVMRLYYK